jgi:hypothetical protein
MAIIAGMVFVFGAYFVWRGLLIWANSGDSAVAAPVDITATQQSLDKTATMDMFMGRADITATPRPTETPAKVCQLFKVNVVRARIRECPKDTCDTISLPEQGSQICVYSLAAQATDWYMIDMNPTGPEEIGYMSKSVLVPMYPTARPTATLNLSTVTPVPTQTPTITPTPAPTNTVDTSITATPTATSTKTPASPLQSAMNWRVDG